MRKKALERKIKNAKTRKPGNETKIINDNVGQNMIVQQLIWGTKQDTTVNIQRNMDFFFKNITIQNVVNKQTIK